MIAFAVFGRRKCLFQNLIASEWIHRPHLVTYIFEELFREQLNSLLPSASSSLLPLPYISDPKVIASNFDGPRNEFLSCRIFVFGLLMARIACSFVPYAEDPIPFPD